MKKSAQKGTNTWGSPKKRDQYTIVLEDLRSRFKLFGENLSFVRDDTIKLREEAAIQGAGLTTVRVVVSTLQEQMKSFDDRMARTEERLTRLEQANLELLKEIRQNTVSRSEFEQLREHVRKLEAKFIHNK